MSYNTSTHVSSTDRVIAGLFAAGVMFMLGYTVVRATLSQSSTQTGAVTESSDVQVTIPGEGTLWADFGTSY